ncbi:MAG TPA: phage holin family protein [Longimicrobiales bacterium]
MNGPGRIDDPSLTTLLRQLGTDSSALIRSEIALAKLEAQEMARTAALEGAKVGAAIALATVGGLALVTWLILALGNVMGDHYATAAAVVGAVFLGIGGVLAKKGVEGLKSGAVKPDDTIRTLQEDKRWASQQVQEFKSHIR